MDPDRRRARPVPEPLDVDAVRVVAAGTVLFLVAFLVLLTFRGRLAEAGREEWIWTCLAGVVLGAVGIPVTVRQRSAARRARAEAADRPTAAERAAALGATPPPPPPDSP